MRTGYITFLSIFLTGFSVNPALINQNDVDKAGLKGKIKSCTVITFNVFGQAGPEQKKFFSSKIQTDYNISGNIVDEINLTENNIIRNKIVYKYGPDGKRLTLKDTSGLFSGEVKNVKDKDGNRIETTTFSNGNKIIKKYDQEQHLVENIMNNPSGKLISKALYKYDQRGNNISENDYDFKNELIHKIILQYDVDNHNVQKAYFDKDDKLTMKLINGYNKNGLLVTRTVVNELTGETHKIWNTFSKYDDIGNWTQSVELHDNVIKNIKNRELAYY